MRPRRLAGAAALLAGAALLAPAAAAAAPRATVVSLRAVSAGPRTPAPPPYTLRGRYRYRAVYRVSGDVFLRVSRAAALVGPDGRVVARVRPRSDLVDPGEFTARGPLLLPRSGPRGVYRLQYTVVARDARGAVARDRRAIRFRVR